MLNLTRATLPLRTDVNRTYRPLGYCRFVYFVWVGDRMKLNNGQCLLLDGCQSSPDVRDQQCWPCASILSGSLSNPSKDLMLAMLSHTAPEQSPVTAVNQVRVQHLRSIWTSEPHLISSRFLSRSKDLIRLGPSRHPVH